MSHDGRRVAGERVLHGALRDAVYGVPQRTRHLNAGNGTNQTADQIKDEVEINGFSAGRARTSICGLQAGHGSPLRNRRCITRSADLAYANLDLSLFRTFSHQQDMTLQLRIEALNATNTPHFANPASNVANLQLNTDGTVRSLNGFGVITSTNRLGRQYDERSSV